MVILTQVIRGLPSWLEAGMDVSLVLADLHSFLVSYPGSYWKQQVFPKSHLTEYLCWLSSRRTTPRWGRSIRWSTPWWSSRASSVRQKYWICENNIRFASQRVGGAVQLLGWRKSRDWVSEMTSLTFRRTQRRSGRLPWTPHLPVVKTLSRVFKTKLRSNFQTEFSILN